MLLTLFPEEERRRQKKRAKENKQSGGARGKTPSDNLAPPNSNQRRTAEYKKVQDLFSKNRKMLADKIASGEPLDSPTIFPEMSAVMDVHGEVFRSTAPRDDYPIRPVSQKPVADFSIITPEEVAIAKRGWQRSAPGRDGVTVPAVSRLSNNVLATLFNILLVSRYQPLEWREMRTVLIPKPGKNRKGPTNWRPITIGSSIQRLFHRLLAHRLSNIVSLDSNQRGFVKTDGTLANSLILDTIIAERTQARKGTSLISMDLRKAFDSVSHHSIIRGVRRARVWLEMYRVAIRDVPWGWLPAAP